VLKPRVVFFDGVILLLWTFACFIYLGIFGFNILLCSLGVVFGFVFGILGALKQISSLEKNGEFKVTLKIGALMLLTIIIAIPIAIYSIFIYGTSAGFLMLSFIYPYLPAFYAARIILYLTWERKTRRLILYDWTRVYVASRNFEKSSSG
jgi:hypothetical protein